MNTGKKVVIRYLYHSGFTLEYGDSFLVFDYFKHDDSLFDLGDEIADQQFPYVFVSHNHHDHYNKDIFKWSDRNKSIQYILSSDVKHLDLNNNCIVMNPYEKIEEGSMTISTYGSTDEGVSFLVNINGLNIFHAGDLNWWHWADESTPEELLEEEEKFKNEVERFEHEKIDIMFFPVDPRLGDYYYLGGEYMINKFKPGLFVPMHFADNNEVTEKFTKKVAYTGVNTAVINHKGQLIEYNFHK